VKKVRTWSVLVARAEARVAAALGVVAAANRRLREVAASAARLDALHADYVARLRTTQSAPHSMVDNMMYRRYIDHVETLQRRLAEKQAAVSAELAAAKGEHLAAQTECMKFRHLMEREAGRLLLEQREKEQAETERAAIAQFNRR